MKSRDRAFSACASIASATAAMAQPTFQGLGFLPGGTSSEAAGVSADGTVVVGTNLAPQVRAFRWTQAGGMVDLGVLPGMTESHATAVSADGQVVVGWCQNPGPSRPFRWTAGTGMVALFDATGCFVSAKAYGVSGDGSVIAGDSDSCGVAFRWTAATGPQVLARLLCDGYHARSVTPDGSRIVGWSVGALPPACSGTASIQATIWPASGGAIGVRPPAAGTSALAYAASADASVLAGALTNGHAARWSAAEGWVDLTPWSSGEALAVSPDGVTTVGTNGGCGQQAAINDGTLELFIATNGLNVRPWHLLEATGVASGRSVIVGTGINLSNQREAWSVRFVAPPSHCYPNCDNSTTPPFLNILDFICFTERFAAGDPYSSCEDRCAGLPPWGPNVSDFVCFQAKFAAGCSAP